MEQNPPEEERFYRNVLDLLALLHELVSDCWDAGVKDVNPILIGYAEGYIQDYDKTELITNFIERSEKYWREEIFEKKSEFFIKHANKVFQNLPVDAKHVDAFKVLFTAIDQNGDDVIIEEDREAVWVIVHSLVKISLKYIHRERKMVLKSTKDGLKPYYVKPLYQKIKVREMAKLYNVQLPIPGQ